MVVVDPGPRGIQRNGSSGREGLLERAWRRQRKLLIVVGEGKERGWRCFWCWPIASRGKEKAKELDLPRRRPLVSSTTGKFWPRSPNGWRRWSGCQARRRRLALVTCVQRDGSSAVPKSARSVGDLGLGTVCFSSSSPFARRWVGIVGSWVAWGWLCFPQINFGPWSGGAVQACAFCST